MKNALALTDPNFEQVNHLSLSKSNMNLIVSVYSVYIIVFITTSTYGDWTDYNYITDSTLRTYEEAKTHCESIGTTLASIPNGDGNEMARYRCDGAGNNNYCWIGLENNGDWEQCCSR